MYNSLSFYEGFRLDRGVILLNMGGPNNLDEVELFLKNMFNDKNIITVKSDLLRKFIAFMITFSRKKSAKENYKKLGGFSPIVPYTKKLINKLQKSLPSLHVNFAMCYTPPFVDEALKDMLTCKEIIVLPLYPHYSTTTTKSSLEDFYLHVKELGGEFKVREVGVFYKNKLFNNLLLKLIKEALKGDNPSEFDLIFSAHSLPQSIVDKGDPYEKQINEHVEILKDLLLEEGIEFKATHLAYQSKLGPVEWLKPELGEKLKMLENKKVIIFPISFTIDNSETEFELSMEYKLEADKFGFEDYRVCKCPNDKDEFVKVLISLIEEVSPKANS